jgi:hypothetical protein
MPIPTSQREFERESRSLVDAAEASLLLPASPSCSFRFGVISGCAGPLAARQIKLKKRTPELDRADLKLRNLLAG